LTPSWETEIWVEDKIFISGFFSSQEKISTEMKDEKSFPKHE